MASRQLVQILILVTACILVQAENNQAGCTRNTNQSATVETATLVKELESEAVDELTSTVMSLVKSEQVRMAKVKAAVAEVKADMTSEMTIKAIVRELKAELTKDHSMAVSELKVMLKKQEERTEDLATDMKELRKGLSYRLENSERKIEWAITDGSLAPRNTSWVTESFKQLEEKIDNMDHQLNQSHQDLIKRTTLNDCAGLYHTGYRTSGLYTIRPQFRAEVKVYCDMVTDGGGWTVFQKRDSGEVDFFRGWQDYAGGFGDAEREYWLGLRYIHELTKAWSSELYVGLTDFDVGAVYAKYGTFIVASEAEKFRLTVLSYSGNASDSLAYSNGKEFSTKDQDNDGWPSGDCSQLRHGAWWYGYCSNSNLNGRFSPTKVSGDSYMCWSLYSRKIMKTSVMMMRPANFKP